jgi:hypothetical protein
VGPDAAVIETALWLVCFLPLLLRIAAVLLQFFDTVGESKMDTPKPNKWKALPPSPKNTPDDWVGWAADVNAAIVTLQIQLDQLEAKLDREVPKTQAEKIGAVYRRNAENLAAVALADVQLQTEAHFKRYVHDRLDKAGVPEHFPGGKHTAEGCRIGDRLDWLLDREERRANAKPEHSEEATHAARQAALFFCNVMRLFPETEKNLETVHKHATTLRGIYEAAGYEWPKDFPPGPAPLDWFVPSFNQGFDALLAGMVGDQPAKNAGAVAQGRIIAALLRRLGGRADLANYELMPRTWEVREHVPASSARPGLVLELLDDGSRSPTITMPEPVTRLLAALERRFASMLNPMMPTDLLPFIREAATKL